MALTSENITLPRLQAVAAILLKHGYTQIYPLEEVTFAVKMEDDTPIIDWIPSISIEGRILDQTIGPDLATHCQEEHAQKQPKPNMTVQEWCDTLNDCDQLKREMTSVGVVAKFIPTPETSLWENFNEGPQKVSLTGGERK